MLDRFIGANRKLSRWMEERFRPFFASESYRVEMMRRIELDLEREPGDVLEVGGIDRPLLKKVGDYGYDGMDVEHKEACDAIYDHFLQQSVEDPIPRSYGMVISYTLLEHVRNNEAAFDSIYRALVPGGTTHHYVPSCNHPYALCLRLVGPRLQRRLIRRLRPGSAEETGYPAFFHHCSPDAMRALLAKTGFAQIEIRPYYRANDYFAFFAPAFALITAFENLCRRMGWSRFASGFVVSARKPGREWDPSPFPTA